MSIATLWGEAFLLLGGGQPADLEQVFGIGRAGDTVLARQPQRRQGDG
ncbi:hypothetical protein QRZ34_27410 [Klebsiella michiganensis]|nr:hypothetical protein [Klebsiella michiganensis]MDL4454764.1 hypothetical protein [Klebsiella michiganensis]